MGKQLAPRLRRPPRLHKFVQGTVAAIELYNRLSTGWDNIKTQTGTETKVGKLRPKTIAHGWYVDYMTGIQHKFPSSWNAVKSLTGVVRNRFQTASKQDGILARVNEVTLFNINDLLYVQAITEPGIYTYFLGDTWKVMFSNLSNIKMCYEYYLVTPIGEQASNFQTQLNALTSTLYSSEINDIWTSWTPADTPEILKNWRILSKSVFRLSPGETGEIHGKDKIYKKFGDAMQVYDRTYLSGCNVQLYCRWYGAPTAIASSTTPPAEPIAAIATFGANATATSWIVETEQKYMHAINDAPNVGTWNTSVTSTLLPGQIVVTETHEDMEVVKAE